MFRITLLALLFLGLACTQSEARRGSGEGPGGYKYQACEAIFSWNIGLLDAKDACKDKTDRGLCIATAMGWVANGDWNASAFETAVTTMLGPLVVGGVLTQYQSDVVEDAYATCITDNPSGSGLKDMEKCLVNACSDVCLGMVH